ncbi:MAG: (2Fe-2S)-binding protein [Pseudomonadota bacterium]
MIVCVCNRVSERDIEHAVRAGNHHFDALCDETRVASCCGRCHDCAREVFDAACARHGVAPAGGTGPAGRSLMLAVQA